MGFRLLQPGYHDFSVVEFVELYSFSGWRREVLDEFLELAHTLRAVPALSLLYLIGEFISDREESCSLIVVWDPAYIDWMHVSPQQRALLEGVPADHDGVKLLRMQAPGDPDNDLWIQMYSRGLDIEYGVVRINLQAEDPRALKDLLLNLDLEALG